MAIYLKNSYKLIFVSEEKWRSEKEKYISNLKNSIKYTMLEEPTNVEPKEVIPKVDDVFDMSKIEIE